MDELDLIKKYLPRCLTLRERHALEIIVGLLDEVRGHMLSRKFEIEREVAKANAELQSMEMQKFVEAWSGE
jgi:hypothetical protein